MGSGQASAFFADYLRVLLISLNSTAIFVPRADSEAIRKTAMSAAISPYSIAVAPESSARNDIKDFNKSPS